MSATAVQSPDVLMVDNYDSFTWNVVQYFWELGASVDVYRNDEISIDDIDLSLIHI